MNRLLNPNNHLLELARTGYRLPAFLSEKIGTILDYVYPIVALLLAVPFLIAGQLMGALFASFILYTLAASERGTLAQVGNFDIFMPETAFELTLFLIASFAPLFFILWGWLILFEKRSLGTVGLERRQVIYKYLRGLFIGLLMFAASVGISAAFGYIAFEAGDPQEQGMAALGGVLMIFFGWVVQGAGEELLTRGWLLQVIGSRYNAAAGILLSSLLFALLHGLNPNVSWIALLNIFLFGVFAALYALYEEGLWGVFSIHSAWNWAQGNLFGFEVSGLDEVGSTLINLMEVGPDTITGGPFGPEGGLAATIVLLASSAILWLVSQRRVTQEIRL